MNEIFHISKIRDITSFNKKDKRRLYQLTESPNYQFWKALDRNTRGDLVITARDNKQIVGWGLLMQLDYPEYDNHKLIGFFTEPLYRCRGVSHLIAQRFMNHINKLNGITLYYSSKNNKLISPLINNYSISVNTSRYY